MTATISYTKDLTLPPEIDEVERCVALGDPQSPLAPLADTLQVLELLDAARHQIGVHYDADARNACGSDRA